MSRFSDLSQAIQEMQEASASDNGDKGYLVTIASLGLDSVESSHVRVFVPPYCSQNIARASSAHVVISPNPLRIQAQYWRPRAFDIDRCALQVPYMQSRDASFRPGIAAPCRHHLADSHFSASPSEGRLGRLHFCSTSVRAFLRPAGLTGPTIA